MDITTLNVGRNAVCRAQAVLKKIAQAAHTVCVTFFAHLAARVLLSAENGSPGDRLRYL